MIGGLADDGFTDSSAIVRRVFNSGDFFNTEYTEIGSCTEVSKKIGVTNLDCPDNPLIRHSNRAS